MGSLLTLVHQTGVHGRVDPQAVLLTPAGSVALIGSGFAELDAFSFPKRHPVDRVSYLSPERIAGSIARAGDDVFALGSLYYTCLSGQQLRPGSTAEEAQTKPVALPGALPVPRPSLIHLFARALTAPDGSRIATPAAFGESAEEEREAAGLPPAQPEDVAELLSRLSPATPRGGAAVVASPAAHPSKLPSLRSSSGPAGWAGVLPSEDLPASPPASASGASTPGTPASSAPAEPSAPAASSGPSQPSGPTEPHTPATPRALPMPSAEAQAPGPRAPSSVSGRPYDRSPSQEFAAVDPKLLPPELRALRSDGLEGIQRRTPHPKVDDGPSHGALLAVVGVVLLVGGGGYLYLTRTSPTRPDERPTRAAPPPPVTRAPPVRQKPPPAPPPAEEAKRVDLLTVMSQPSGATVEIDGGYVGRTPLVLKHKFESRNYRVTISKDGFQPVMKMVSPDPKKGGISLTLELLPSAP